MLEPSQIEYRVTPRMPCWAVVLCERKRMEKKYEEDRHSATLEESTVTEHSVLRSEKCTIR